MGRLMGNAALSEIGDLELWTPDGNKGERLRDVAPRGCVLYYAAPGCPSCLDAVLELPNWLTQQGRDRDPVIVLIDSGENALQFEREMVQAGVTYPVRTDLQQALRARYGIWQNPVILVLNGTDLLLTAVAVWDSRNGFHVVSRQEDDLMTQRR